jgi:hypothetical protein
MLAFDPIAYQVYRKLICGQLCVQSSIVVPAAEGVRSMEAIWCPGEERAAIAHGFMRCTIVQLDTVLRTVVYLVHSEQELLPQLQSMMQPEGAYIMDLTDFLVSTT